MRHKWLGLVLLGSLITAACSPAQIVVTAEIEVPDPDAEGAMMTSPLSDYEIQVIPFDRDAIFDSLTAAFATPEPPIPADFLEAQAEIRAAQEEWRSAEATWGAGRARLQEILDEMEGLARGEARYVALFREYEDIEASVNRSERAKDRAFEAFTDLQESYIAREDSLRFIRETWADDAFATFWDVAAVKMDEVGLEMVFDTTNAQGVAGPIDLDPGTWWVMARHELPYSQLYWNIRIDVVRGEPMEVRLTPANAVERPNF